MDLERCCSPDKNSTTTTDDVSMTKCEPLTLDENKKPENETCEDILSKHEDKNTFEDSHKTDEKTKNEMDEANLHYEDDVCIYTDPDTKCQYVWDEGKQEWMPRDTSDQFSDKDYQYDGKSYTYTDSVTNIKYAWNEDSNEWKIVDSDDNPNENTTNEEGEEDEEKKKNPTEITAQDMTQGCYSFEDDTHIYTDPSDGTKYFWDKEKNAWFPRVDDDFLARYQMSYGFVDPNANDPKPEVKDQPPKEAEKRKAPQEPAWFEVGEETTKVYVSGLPLDITESEFVDVMQKCGLVMRDVDSGKMKVKIYFDPQTSLPKGDALCTYIKKESVELALELLDGSDLRGHRIHVERAKFTLKGEYNPSLKPKKKRKKDKEKMKKMQEKLFAWMPDKLRGERSKHEKIVIVKNLFQPEIFDKDVKLILEYQQDLREECLKCGSVKKVVVFDRHPEGVAQVNFKEFEAADACVQLLNGRWFGQRKITAEIWDGKTKYKITETDEEIKARLAKWEKFLESGEAGEKGEANKNKTNIEEPNKMSERVKMDSGNIQKDSDNAQEGTESIQRDSDNIQSESESIQRDSDNIQSQSESIQRDADNIQSQSESIQRDSDGDTRSSVESDFDTDDETKT